MTDWAEFDQQAPELAEVDFVAGDVLVGSLEGAVKARDLRRDGRCAIHAHPSAIEDGDAKIAAVAAEGPAIQVRTPFGST